MKRIHSYHQSRVGRGSLFCCFMAVVLLSVQMATAQPQAPIEWGEARLLQDGSEDVDILTIKAAAWGDTIVHFGVIDGPGSDFYATVSITGDNGLTWSPWHTFTVPGISAGPAWAVQVSEGICVITKFITGTGPYLTTDLGLTWLDPLGTRPVLANCVSREDTIFCHVYGPDYLFTYTANRGLSYAPNRAALPGVPSRSGIGVGRDYLHVIMFPYSWHLYYARAPLAEGPFEPADDLNPQIAISYEAAIEFDTSGTGVIATVGSYAPPAPSWGALLLNISHDDGETWSPADTITPNESADEINPPRIAHCGSLWAISWIDSTRSAPPDTNEGAWLLFSANQCRSWYPPRKINQLPYIGGGLSTLDLRPDYIRLYATYVEVDEIRGMYYFQWEGSIHADTLAPILTNAEMMPETVPVDTTLHFGIEAIDNDSIWQMQVVLWAEGSEDSILLSLSLDAEQHYGALWEVPPDTTDWFYYYRAEDMWEHVSCDPPEGPSQPRQFHAGPLNTNEQTPAAPLDLSLQLYPNPANSEVTISGTFPPGVRKEVLIVYDLLGREAARITVRSEGVGEFHARWDLTNSSNQPLGSGTYFLLRTNRATQRIAKLTILR